MKLKTSLRLGLETIAFQSDPALFNDLRIVINKLRTEKSITADKLKKSGLDKIIHSRTGITIFPVLETGAKGIVTLPMLNRLRSMLIIRWLTTTVRIG